MVGEAIETGTQVTGGIHLDVIEAHHQGEELLQGTEAEEVGQEVHLYHAAPSTEVAVVIVVAWAVAEALFVLELQLTHLDVMPHHTSKSEGHRAGAAAGQQQGRPRTISCQNSQPKQGQDPRLEVQEARGA